jgi:hypothetical protein
MLPLLLLLSCLHALLTLGGCESKVALVYDGKSIYSKVELSEHITLREFTVSVWLKLHRKVSYGHLPQCVFAKGDWRSVSIR